MTARQLDRFYKINLIKMEFSKEHKSLEAEKGVLSCILMEDNLIDQTALNVKDFYLDKHQTIYRTMKKLKNKDKTIDVVTLKSSLKEQDLNQIGWTDYLYDLASYVATPTLIYDYKDIVKEKSETRQIKKLWQNIINQVNDEEDPTEVASYIVNKIKDIQSGQDTESSKAKDVVVDRIEEYAERADEDNDLEDITDIIKLGYFDDYLNWWVKWWQLIVLAARPAMGKTSLSLNCTINAARKKDVWFISAEMDDETLVDRLVSSISGVPMTDIAEWYVDQDDLHEIGRAGETLQWLQDIIINDGSITTVSGIRRFLNLNEVDILFIDYLQLMKAEWNTRQEEVSKISRELKEIAREFDIPIIALSQLNRWVENRPNKRPKLADLRESGSIEQDADAVFMLYREHYYDEDYHKPKEAQLICRKNRNGATGTLYLRFEKEIMKFIPKQD